MRPAAVTQGPRETARARCGYARAVPPPSTETWPRMTDIVENDTDASRIAENDPGATRTKVDAARSIERLRLAEGRLARRRQNECGPSENARAATRFIFDMSDQGVAVTPTDVAEHLGISTPSVTGILNRLYTGGIITFLRHPDDGRSKYVVPLDRDGDIDGIDPLTAQIRGLADTLTADQAAAVAAFIDLVTDAVDDECR
ncbi:MAG: hypothetical protein CMH38_01025 [Microbacterium sp.]|nr:hypothetical protein [Microbacterium sp.]HBS73606.1 hypothetical protein [Microbacterium sp.]